MQAVKTMLVSRFEIEYIKWLEKEVKKDRENLRNVEEIISSYLTFPYYLKVFFFFLF